MKLVKDVMIVARTREKSGYSLANNHQYFRKTYRSGKTRHRTCGSCLLSLGH
jgi:hypothetical protein